MTYERITRLKGRAKDLTGKRFGRLVAVEPMRGKHGICWLCRCDCGEETIVRRSSLTGKLTTSCGCVHIEVVRELGTTHGLSGSPEHQIWQSMLQRCHNENNAAYKNYGGRGIEVCGRWRDSFESFLSDVGCRPTRHHELDRIDNERGYEPGNVRWTTRQVNARNQRKSIYLTVNNETKHLVEWANEVGISANLIRDRRSRGWPPERCIQPITRKRKST